MTRHLNQYTFGYDGAMDYQQPSRMGHHHIAHDRSYTLTRQNPRSDPMARQQPRTVVPHPATLPSNGSGGPPRRRIPVACGRCRKRKIRCSGDPGDGTGCLSCKSARVQPGQCIFLRVSSSNVELTNPYSSSMTSSSYAGMSHASVSTPALSSTLSSQPPMRTGSHSISIASPVSLKTQYSDTLGSGSIDATPGLLIGGRSSYDGLGGDIGSTNNVSGPTDINFPQYMLPTTESGPLTDSAAPNTCLGSQHELLRQWTPLSGNGGRGAASNTGYYIDHESSGIGSSMSSCSISRSMSNNPTPGTTSIETYPLFPALNSLSSSLPDSISRSSISDKALPPPLPVPPQRFQASDHSAYNTKGGLSLANTLSSDLSHTPVGYKSMYEAPSLSSSVGSRSSASSALSSTASNYASATSLQAPAPPTSTSPVSASAYSSTPIPMPLISSTSGGSGQQPLLTSLDTLSVRPMRNDHIQRPEYDQKSGGLSTSSSPSSAPCAAPGSSATSYYQSADLHRVGNLNKVH